MLMVLLFKRDWSWILRLKENPKLIFWFLALSSLISINWYLYIWAVNDGQIVETSLGYFMNPLVNVLLGVVLLKERPRRLQWAAILIAFSGVAFLTFAYGKLPWIALTLAFSFGIYGLLKKLVAIGPLRGLTIETAFLFIPAIIFLATTPSPAFTNTTLGTDVLLVFGGIVTGTPLLLFAGAARNLSMTTLGLMQYMAPTIQFLIGIWIYKEPFSQDQLIGFSIIWFALSLFAMDLLSLKRATYNAKKAS
tara:strand:- start:235286 stop:236035 length:750 start_codon:yes stop_codon:yes gene_type:complete